MSNDTVNIRKGEVKFLGHIIRKEKFNIQRTYWIQKGQRKTAYYFPNELGYMGGGTGFRKKQANGQEIVESYNNQRPEVTFNVHFIITSWEIVHVCFL